METLWTFARIKLLRRLMGLTQEKFAREVGVSVHTVSAWEREKIDTPHKLARDKLDSLWREYCKKEAANEND